MRIRSRDGKWTVDVVNVDGTEWLRITGASGFYIGQVRTVEELARFGIDLSQMDVVSDDSELGCGGVVTRLKPG